MLLAGFTGQVSIGHAAFMGVGGYTQAVLTGWGVPFPLALAGATALSGVMGVVISVPALRLKECHPSGCQTPCPSPRPIRPIGAPAHANCRRQQSPHGSTRVPVWA